MKNTLKAKINIRKGGTMGRPRKESVVTVDRVSRPTLANERFDPFNKFKTEPDKFHYRAINTRAHQLRRREAEGYQTIAGSEFGDLVLAKIPKEIKEQRAQAVIEKSDMQKEAGTARFKEDAERAGVETY
jgi:hypothetical protein